MSQEGTHYRDSASLVGLSIDDRGVVDDIQIATDSQPPMYVRGMIIADGVGGFQAVPVVNHKQEYAGFTGPVGRGIRDLG